MADVVLVYPKTGFDIGGTVTPPHALLTIAAPLNRKGYKIRIIDQRVDRGWKQSLAEELKSDPICVGISSMTGSQIDYALEAAKFVRSHTDGRIPLVWGGPHPTILPEQTLQSPYVDVVVVGEGDVTFTELVEAMQSKKPLKDVLGVAFKDGGRVEMTPARPLLEVETLLPTPWELVNVEQYIHPDFYLRKSHRTLDIGQTSRGCPYDCGFCCSATLRQRRWRTMSVEKALDVIVGNIKRYNLDGMWIRDDNFYVNPKRVAAICSGMVEADAVASWYSSGTRADDFLRLDAETLRILKRSGANVVKIGGESGCNRILELMNKGITVDETFEANLRAKEFGLTPAFSFMAGLPTETFEEINMTIDAITKIGEDNPKAEVESICIFTAFPGTPLYPLALQAGLQPPDKLDDWAAWNFHEYNLGGRNPWFSLAERRKLGNLTYMSSLANVVPNLVKSFDSPVNRFLTTLLAVPISKYYGFRLRHKMYGFAPELKLFQLVRQKMFDSKMRIE